jgi:hypothetical protein
LEIERTSLLQANCSLQSQRGADHSMFRERAHSTDKLPPRLLPQWLQAHDQLGTKPQLLAPGKMASSSTSAAPRFSSRRCNLVVPGIGTIHGRVHRFHCGGRGLRPIAFALGRKVEDRWYVLQLQSDIAFNCGSAIGNHFRGWSRVLLDCLHRQSAKTGCKLFVCPSEQVIRAVAPASLRPRCVPNSWRQIYDLSAETIGMKKRVIPETVNLQLHPRLDRVLCRQFYSFECDDQGHALNGALPDSVVLSGPLTEN